MSSDWMSAISRRPFLSGLLGVLGIGAIGGAIYETPKLFKRRYAPTPYDDLLDLAPDRAAAVRVGYSVYIDTPIESEKIARGLRSTLARQSLLAAVDSDLKKHLTVEAGGWVLPITIIELCVLAAQVDEAARQPRTYP
jgi:hypothetical protein